MSDQWIDTLRQKKSQIDLLASWASQVNLGTCRDHLRLASADIACECSGWSRASIGSRMTDAEKVDRIEKLEDAINVAIEELIDLRGWRVTAPAEYPSDQAEEA